MKEVVLETSTIMSDGTTGISASSPHHTHSTAPTMDKAFFRAAVLVVVLAVSAVLTTGAGAGSTPSPAGMGDDTYGHWLVLVHLLAFAAWFGCSVWVTLVAGIVMFKSLPRHTFGRLQAKLFPAYFWFSAVTVSIAAMTAHLLGWDNGTRTLMLILGAVLWNLLYLEPKTTAVMFKRQTVERRLGTGHEVGALASRDDPKIGGDAEWKELSRSFGVLHGLSTVSNLAALGVGCYWLNICASQMAAAAAGTAHPK